MIFVTKFRTNDLDPSKGKQIEFNSGVVRSFFGFTKSDEDAVFECCSLAAPTTIHSIKVHFTLSPSRGDYKVYQNLDGSMDLKDYFLNILHLTSANISDYFAIKKNSASKYMLYYVPDGETAASFFRKFSSDKLYFIPDNDETFEENKALQVIFYGCPGTGKSHELNKITDGYDVIRTTFHPNSDYATFVGAYKPVETIVPKTMTIWDSALNQAIEHPVVTSSGAAAVEKKITYQFVQQAFLKAYVEAWKKLSNSPMWAGGASTAPVLLTTSATKTLSEVPNPNEVDLSTEKDLWENQERDLRSTILTSPAPAVVPDEMNKQDVQFLIIEEINRGDCAQIFGDIFQLLDRNDYGFSSYPIEPDSDIQRALKESFEGISIPDRVDKMYKPLRSGKISDGIKEGRLMLLPSNLFIYATMNTSDQSLFPMDSAFKRRWDWRYFAIKDEGKGYQLTLDGQSYEWWKLLEELNRRILELTHSSDKQMGYWFIKLPEGVTEIPVETFVSKVVFYLWNDVFKDYAQDGGNPFTDETRFEKFYDGEGNVQNEVLKVFLENLFKEKASDENPE